MITRKTKKLVYNIVVIALLVIGMAYVCSRFIHLGNVEYTDNAQVKQHITPVNTRVQGFIKKIYFDEYKPIHKGDTLLVIEDAEFRLRLAQAEADLANALAGQQVTSAGIATTQNNLTVNDASIEEVRVQRANAERELQRYKKLLEEDAVTRQKTFHILDQRRTDASVGAKRGCHPFGASCRGFGSSEPVLYGHSRYL